MANDEWETPEPLFDRLDRVCLDLTGDVFKFDVCAGVNNRKIPFAWMKEDDALSKGTMEWAENGPCWMNPPYSKIEPWVAMAEAVQKTGGVVFALIPLSAETRYFQKHVMGVAETILVLNRRIRFVGAPSGAKGPNVVAIYRPHLGGTRWVPFEISTEEAGQPLRKKKGKCQKCKHVRHEEMCAVVVSDQHPSFSATCGCMP
ncbi:MAG TPA: DNA N-6-adenine-methyltransferase [Acidobacteriota bacterium]|nr:DNA N-6-adenine-methyltransferase [Acidobacteriota bacterium]